MGTLANIDAQDEMPHTQYCLKFLTLSNQTSHYKSMGESFHTLAHKHQFKILLTERCEIDYLHRLVLTSVWSEKLHHKSAKKSIKLW